MPGLGKVRARCKGDTCALEFDAPPSPQVLQAVQAATGQTVVSAVRYHDEKRYATEVRLKRKER